MYIFNSWCLCRVRAALNQQVLFILFLEGFTLLGLAHGADTAQNDIKWTDHQITANQITLVSLSIGFEITSTFQLVRICPVPYCCNC